MCLHAKQCGDYLFLKSLYLNFEMNGQYDLNFEINGNLSEPR